MRDIVSELRMPRVILCPWLEFGQELELMETKNGVVDLLLVVRGESDPRRILTCVTLCQMPLMLHLYTQMPGTTQDVSSEMGIAQSHYQHLM